MLLLLLYSTIKTLNLYNLFINLFSNSQPTSTTTSSKLNNNNNVIYSGNKYTGWLVNLNIK